MKKCTLLLICLGLLAGCGQKIKTIPEITAHLTEEQVYELKDIETVGKIATVNRGKELILITLKGQGLGLDLEKKTVTPLFDLSRQIEKEIFTQNQFALLKEQGKHRYIIVDLEGKKVAAYIEDRNLGNVIGIDKSLMVIKREGKLVFFDYLTAKRKARISTKDEEVFNCHFTGDAVLVLTTTSLHIFEKSSGKVETLDMIEKPTSGFLWDKGYLYFGNSKRELIKFSWTKQKRVWGFKLPEKLEVAPRRAGHHICITPRDNNIYFFSPRGSLRWWTKLEAPRVLEAVSLKDHVAVFLMNREYRTRNNKIQFYDYKKKNVYPYEFQQQIESNPVYAGKYLYILSTDPEKGTKTVTRIGNRYDAELLISPQYVKPVGKSIKFTFIPINLIEPQAHIKILDNKETLIFEKNIANEERPSFIWIPEKPGTYTVTAVLNGENRTGITVKQGFQVIELEKISDAYYYQLMTQCPHSAEVKKEAPEPEKPKEKVKKKDETDEDEKQVEEAQPVKKKEKNKPKGKKKKRKKK